jgi:2,3,4,5-tetrahydropyridine-2-carboxylate N-succinyltransferase
MWRPRPVDADATTLTKGRQVDDATLKQVTQLWEAGDGWRDILAPAAAHDVVESVVAALDRGEVRVADVVDGRVVVNEPAKHAVLMWFRVNEMQEYEAGPFEYVDKLPLKHGYLESGVRVVPGASARFGAYLAPSVVMMPSYVNIGAYVDEGTMVDTWATVGSCAQIGKRVHLSGGVGIGGVLEPPQAAPVVIEDDCFIGSRCMIVEGARVRRGAKIGPGLILTATVPVIEADTGAEVGRGIIPERAIVVSGTRFREYPGGTFGLPCALILRYLDEGEEHDKLKLNAMLREHGIVS